jgi:molybdate transport system regulatory protein
LATVRQPLAPRPVGLPAEGSEKTVPFPELEVRSKLWIEVDGEVVLSDYRAALLEGIERTGSLARAAEELKVPYRTAWQRLKESEERLGFRLVESQSGGAEGGGSVLTPAARELLRRYRDLSQGLDQLVDDRFRKTFQ